MNWLIQMPLLARVWIERDSPFAKASLAAQLVITASFILAGLLYFGSAVVIIKFAVAFFNFTKASENPQEQAAYRDDMKESFIGALMFYAFVFLAQQVGILILELIPGDSYATAIAALKSFWSVVKNAKGLLGL